MLNNKFAKLLLMFGLPSSLIFLLLGDPFLPPGPPCLRTGLNLRDGLLQNLQPRFNLIFSGSLLAVHLFHLRNNKPTA
jgi:hypothetical protein